MPDTGKCPFSVQSIALKTPLENTRHAGKCWLKLPLKPVSSNTLNGAILIESNGNGFSDDPPLRHIAKIDIRKWPYGGVICLVKPKNTSVPYCAAKK